jgi:RNA polymerase sigma-B factor
MTITGYPGREPDTLDIAAIHRVYAKSHDPELEAELLRRYQPLARQLAMSFSHRGEPLEDLCQVALLALLRALRNFNPDRGAQFSSYAMPSIAGTLKRHFRDRGWLVRPPRRFQEAYLVVTSATEQLGAELGRPPLVGEIAEYTGLPIGHVMKALEVRGGRRAVPFEVLVRAHDAEAWEALVSDNGAQAARAEDHVFIAQAVGLLPAGERAVVMLSFMSGLTEAEIAARLGTSQSTVSRLRRQAIERLRQQRGDDASAA